MPIFLAALSLNAQPAAKQGVIRGQVKDPSGAVVPHAHISATSNSGGTVTSESTASGFYRLSGLPAGSYRIAFSAAGFAGFQADHVQVSANRTLMLNVSLIIEAAPQEIEVNGTAQAVSTSPENNANALVMKGRDLDALSDDPEELLNDLEALASPSAGPGGAQIYVDGFSGGPLPPKSSIREIRINQNPFSAQYDRLGYGRVEILTKPGTERLHGQIGARGNDSAFNSRNPILQGPQPAYYSYDVRGELGGPLWSTASYFFSIFSRNHDNTSVISAVEPASITDSKPNGSAFTQALDNPNSGLDLSQRVDLQAGKRNTLTLRYDFSRTVNTNQGVGETSLPLQAYNTHGIENVLQLGDSIVLSDSAIDNLRFAYRRIRNRQSALAFSPTVTVQGAFTDGGSNSGAVNDNQDDFELQNYVTAAVGSHVLNFGGRARSYRDANFSDGGSNGAYTFPSTQSYLDRAPRTYAVTLIQNPTARLMLFDAALFYQDDWKANSRFTLSYGLRWETQNRIGDKSDWAPRISLAYAPGLARRDRPPKTVVRAGYGWFYQRFTVPGSFAAMSGTPYLTTAIHQNGVNQNTYTVTQPSGYRESSPGVAIKPPNPAHDVSAQTTYSVARDFHAAIDMQGAIGVDRQIARAVTANLTYLYSRGIHQYLTNNLGAAFFSTLAEGIYPSTGLPAPAENRMQYQSSGVYRQNQIIATAAAHFRRYAAFGFYTYGHAKGDTAGVTYVPSIAQDPGFDYGRTDFDIHHRLVVGGSMLAPFGVSLSPMLIYNSGTPYNVTIGSDLTGNNQFNARPTFALPQSCNTAADRYVASPWGCLDADPIGTNERIVPYGLGTGPANVALNLHLSRTFGIGPRVSSSSGAAGGAPPPPPPGGGQGGLGEGGLSGARSGPVTVNAAAARRYSLTFDLLSHNVLNYRNLGTPNGALNAPPALRFQSQALAGGPFSPPEGGNRSVFLEVHFNF